MVVMRLGQLAYWQGDLARARALVEEAATFFRTADDRTWLAATDWNLGRFAAAEGRFPEAARRYRASLYGHVAAGEATLRHGPLLGLAAMAVDAGRPETAARLLGANDDLLQRMGVGLMPFDRAFDRDAYERAAAGARAALGAAGFAAAQAAGRDLGPDDWLAEADRIVAAIEAAAEAPRRGEEAASGLSPRQLEVVRLIAAGRSNREIADTLFISYGTAITHVRLGRPPRSRLSVCISPSRILLVAISRFPYSTLGRR
jgi:DNA-binding CsgD family transcriptional regulator